MLQFSVTLCDMKKNAIIVLFLTIFPPKTVLEPVPKARNYAIIPKENVTRPILFLKERQGKSLKLPTLWAEVQ